MVEDKYVGLALAVSGTVAIGSSFIITKKVCYISFCCRTTTIFTIHQGLNEAGERGNSYSQASDDHAYLKNPVWWAGMAISERCHTRVLHLLMSIWCAVSGVG
jgi:magnesium transporter